MTKRKPLGAVVPHHRTDGKGLAALVGCTFGFIALSAVAGSALVAIAIMLGGGQ